METYKLEVEIDANVIEDFDIFDFIADSVFAKERSKKYKNKIKIKSMVLADI